MEGIGITAGSTIRAVRKIHWYLRGMLGADAYDKYLEFHESAHGADGHPPMSEREFWWDRDDRQDRNPQGRCC